MNCETTQRELLHLDWDEPQRRQMADVLAHLASCDACRSAMGDFDRLRSSLGPMAPDPEPAGGFSAFEQRLVQRVVPTRRRPQLMPVALAASILLALTGWGMYLGGGRDRPDIGQPGVRAPADYGRAAMGLTPQEIADRVQVFDQVWEVFDRRAGWVVVADRASDLGLGDAPTDAAGGLLLLRLSVSRGDSLFSRADLVIVPGQVAQIAIPSEHGARLRYRITTSQEDPTRLQLWLEVECGNGGRERIGALASELRVKPGQVMPAGQMVTSSGRYDVNVGVYRAGLAAEQS